MSERTLAVGTRGSRLALVQAEQVRAGLCGPSEIRIVHTSGDRFGDRPLGEHNPVGFFTKEIEQQLAAGRIDLAVHSLKDLPGVLTHGLALGALLERDEPSDVLLARADALDRSSEIPLRPGSNVGASSMRRQALLGVWRPDLVPRPIRGNVPTRVDKAIRGAYDAIVLSRAGLQRLALDPAPLVAFELNPLSWPGAAGQAVVAVEVRSGDEEVIARLGALDHPNTRRAVRTERALLMAFGGGCHAPFGAYVRLEPDSCRAVLAAPGSDGCFRVGRFVEDDLDATRRSARAWIQKGCPAGEATEGDRAWLCRPARPWY